MIFYISKLKLKFKCININLTLKTGKDICRCSEDENIPEEIVPTQDTENCTHLIMKFCKYTTMLPSNHVEKMIDKNTAVQGSVYIAIMYKCIPIVRKDGNSQTLEYNTE